MESLRKAEYLYVGRDDITVVISTQPITLSQVGSRVLFSTGDEDESELITLSVDTFSAQFFWMCDTPKLYEVFKVRITPLQTESSEQHQLQTQDVTE